MRTNKSFLLSGTIVAGLTLATLAPQAAMAQQAEGPGVTEVDEIVVTGSRIRRSDLTATAPIQVLGGDNIQERGIVNVGDAISQLPITGTPINASGDQGSFGVGRNYVNLFNLGTQRTLTLVNGRRFVGGNAASLFTGAAPGGQVDFNVIPSALIDRVETVQATGGAVYGSDAVAGVVNVIMRTDFDGLEFNTEYGVSERGDGDQWRARVTAGRNFMDGRANLAGSYEYSETSALGYTDRARTSLQLINTVNPFNTGPDDGRPASAPITDRRIPEVTLGGLPFRAGGIGLSEILTIEDPNNPGQRIAAQFAPDGTLVPYDTGVFYAASVASGGDGMNLAELTSLVSPVDRHVATLFGRYDITNNVRLEGELWFNRSKAVEPFNQPIYNAGLFGGVGAPSGMLRMSTANPFLSPETRAQILAQPVPLEADPLNPGDVLFSLSRASVDIGNNQTSSENDTVRGVINLAGDFQAADRNFFWNVGANHGVVDGFFTSPNVIQSRFVQAIAVETGPDGQPRCADPDARAAGCVPLNLFGQGAPDQAALDWVGVEFRSDFEIKQTVYEANFGGDLIRLPAGTASFNVGYEYRKEESSFQPNEAQEQGIGRSAAITPLQGEYTTREWYAEVLVPVFGGDLSFPGMRSLEFEGSYRDVDNSLAGGDDAYSYGLRWRPINDLMIRATQGKSFRAPAITELFLPQATSFMTATDPCDFRNIDAGPNPAARRANCQAEFAALGLPTDFELTSNVQAATVQGTTSGNLDLVNELADQTTIGFVYQPSFVPGLALTADWVQVELSNSIESFNLTSILQVCYDSPEPPADVCGRFERGTTGAQAGQILGAADAANGTGPTTGYVNAGYRNFEGWTLGIDYVLDLADLPGLFYGVDNPGRIGFDFDMFRVLNQNVSVTGLGFDEVDQRNLIGNADNRWKLDTSYQLDDFSMLWSTRYIGKSVFSNTDGPEQRQPLSVQDYYLNDVSFSYRFGERLGMGDVTARLAVRNVFDVEPPAYTVGVGTYDLMGRFYQLGLTARF
ncbi:MAG: TonB-dependent receptor domain-containing protein [Brevundimonas sp.]|uniref:TonB-dependent receptor domain-containing protein n=1 Tax=Brevundimonas sp. TaxID=1871086 RepID=UPI00391B8725